MDASEIRKAMLRWYDAHRRDLPWRRTRDPYAIWVSEIMLQQTRVAAVIERYQAFMKRFPTVEALAQATEQQVLELWSGLGYYRRARMMHKAAQSVVVDREGRLPQTAAELRTLAGIGSYTAAAIASIAHEEPVAVVDGNVERVLCRVAGWDADAGKGSTALRRQIEFAAARLIDPQRPGDFNQAMMELGATVCLPRNPQCLACPILNACKTRGEHKTASRPAMVTREVAHGLALREDGDGWEVLLEQRPVTETVMAGLWQLPMLKETAVPEEDRRITVRHAIMQVNYRVHIRDVAEEDVQRLTVEHGERRWVALPEAGSMALTGLARKVLKKAGLLESGRVFTMAEPKTVGV